MDVARRRGSGGNAGADCGRAGCHSQAGSNGYVDQRLKVANASKIVSMEQAVADHVPNGSMVLLGAQLEQMIPFAAAHEIIRQGRRELKIAGPISDILFDQMVGAGAVSCVLSAWVGNA